MSGASFSVQVESNLDDASRWVRALATRELPFATAAALSDTARAATERLQDSLAETFTLRNRGLRRGIRWKRAEKRDWPRPYALVYVTPWAGFLALQATGGVKRPGRGAKTVAVPTSRVQRTSSGRVRKSDRPRQLLRRPTGDVVQSDRSLVIRIMKGRRVGRREGDYYTLHKGVRLRPIWRVGPMIAGTVRGGFAAAMRARL